jgi:hypothetical protein
MMEASKFEPRDCYRVDCHPSSRLVPHIQNVPGLQLFYRAIHGTGPFLARQMEYFLQDLALGRVLPAELETKKMKLMTTIEPRTSFRPGTLPFVATGQVEIRRPVSLAEVVDAGVMQVEEQRLKSGGAEVPSLAFEPKVMLAVLTHCYARQMLSASEVWSHLARDPAFRRICQNILPGPEWIRRFRDENREALHECLTIALLFLARQKVSAGTAARAGEPQIRIEARRRIVMAACLDSLEMEAGDRPSQA